MEDKICAERLTVQCFLNISPKFSSTYYLYLPQFQKYVMEPSYMLIFSNFSEKVENPPIPALVLRLNCKSFCGLKGYIDPYITATRKACALPSIKLIWCEFRFQLAKDNR